MNLVFLNLAVMPYHVAVFRALIAKGHKCIVYWYGTAPKTSYRAPKIDGLELYNRFDFETPRNLFEHAAKFTPSVVVCSGWVDKGYNKVCLKFRRIHIPTMATSDTQWKGGKQWFNRLLSPFRHLRCFDYIWGAGILQFDYARKLGFRPDKILLNCFAGDVETFSKVSIDKKREAYPKRFLFVGRFVEVKAIDILLKAWNEIEDKRGWELELIGDGPLKERYKAEYPEVIMKDFMSQSDLAKEAQLAGCFVIPSRFEPWALVIQEFAAAGLPILASKECGASRHFVLNGYNGFRVEVNSVDDLRNKMVAVIGLSEKTLIEYSQNSRKIAETVTPETVADTLLSILS